jgi:hypothetical protein
MSKEKRAVVSGQEAEGETPEIVQVPMVYSNSVQIRVSPWDFSFRFGHVSPVGQDREIAQYDVTVMMSPQHAKATFRLLEQQVANYEKRFGEIPILGNIEPAEAVKVEKE